MRVRSLRDEVMRCWAIVFAGGVVLFFVVC